MPHGGHLIAGIVESRPSFTANLMHAGRVSIMSLKKRHHGLEHGRIERRRGVKIEVNGFQKEEKEI